jgi:preprotein translocase subunit YajC
MFASLVVFFAQATNAASDAGTADSGAAATPTGPAGWTMFLYIILFGGMIYFGLIRPQSTARKKQEETIKAAKTGDKIITTSGIHGVITNVKDSTVIVRVADAVKLEIEKTHIDKITRPEVEAAKPAAKVS